MEAKFTFRRRYGAHTASGRALVYVPDQVIENQGGFSGLSFPVLHRDGRKTRGVLSTKEGMGGRAKADPVVVLQ